MFPDIKDSSDEDLLAGTEISEDEEEGDGDGEGEGEGEGDGDGDGEDQASLALNTPEPARALQAANPVAKTKGGPKAKKGIKDKAADKSSGGEDGRAIGIAIGDELTGLEESSTEEKKPETEAQETSAFDRDEITNPDMDVHEVELLSMLAGMNEKPWENEKLSLTERMMLKQGYERNLEALKQSTEEKAPVEKDRRTVRSGVATVATAVVAAGVVAAGIKTGAEKGSNLAGVSRGPQRAADQEKSSDVAKTEPRKVTKEAVLQQARQNAADVTARRVQQGLSPSLTGDKNAAPQNSKEDSSRKLMQDILEDELLVHQAVPLQAPAQVVSTDPDMQFQQMMNLIYMSLGAETVMNVSPYRVAGWDEKRLEQKENSADVTIPPEPDSEAGPTPEQQLRHNMTMNIGPGGV